MRILLDAETEIGQRAGHIVLAEAAVEYLGVWRSSDLRRSKRTGPTTTIDGFDLAISDRRQGHTDLIARCSVAGIPLVLWSDAEEVAPGSATIPVVIGANVGSALSEVLVHHPSADHASGDEVVRAWTEPGKPLKRGQAVAFPEPVGMSWAKERSPGHFVAFRDDDWGAASCTLTGDAGERIIGVADHAVHLEALVLAATALSAVDGAYPKGVVSASSAGERLMNSFDLVELDFAVWRSHT